MQILFSELHIFQKDFEKNHHVGVNLEYALHFLCCKLQSVINDEVFFSKIVLEKIPNFLFRLSFELIVKFKILKDCEDY